MSFTYEAHKEDQITYVPRLGKNRQNAEDWAQAVAEGKDPEPEFFTATVLPLSARDVNKITARAVSGTRTAEEAAERGERIMMRIFRAYVPNIDGFNYLDAGGVKHSPKTGAAFLDLALGALPELYECAEDIYNALRSKSVADEGDLKKLRSRYAGTAQEKTKITQQLETDDARSVIPDTSMMTEGPAR